MTFNSLLDAATRVDATQWVQKAWIARAAAHADAKEFEKFVDGQWGDKSAPPGSDNNKPKGKGISDLLRDFGGGI
tara:strand:- start:574 stop:798 length:225 start_codon:yes stop_codon:yes gene_type:complete